MNTHYDAAKVEAAVAAHVAARHGDLALTFSEEASLLGTGGGLRRAWELEERLHGPMTDDDVLVAVNGDISFAPVLAPLIAAHRARGALATLVLREVADPFSLGAIEVDPQGRVVSMLARQITTPAGRAAMFTGVHVLSRAALARLPREGCVIREGYRRWLDEGLAVFGVLSDAPWRDLGTPRVYRDAHLEVLRGEHALPGVEAGANWCDPSATVSPFAELEASVIGGRAQVGPHRLVRSVVWPDTRVSQDLIDAIALPDGRIVFV